MWRVSEIMHAFCMQLCACTGYRENTYMQAGEQLRQQTHDAQGAPGMQLQCLAHMRRHCYNHDKLPRYARPFADEQYLVCCVRRQVQPPQWGRSPAIALSEADV